MRTSKTVTSSSGATTAYTYVYEDGQLVQMTRGSRILDFIYDGNGVPVSVAYRSRATANPTYYYYGLNSRGDVVALYNSNGTIAAKYEYDAYANDEAAMSLIVLNLLCYEEVFRQHNSW